MATVTQVEVLSAGSELHPFDVKVSADHESTISTKSYSYVQPYAENPNVYHPVSIPRFENRGKRAHENIFTVRGFTASILVASVLALGLLLASRIILEKRAYGWREERIGMVEGVISTTAIPILASCACAAINVLPITNSLTSTLFNMVIDAVLPTYLLRAGLGLLENEQGRWSYEARDWCANPHHGGCVRLVCVLGHLNETAGYITVGIGFIHIGLFLTRFVTVCRSRRGFKRSPLRTSSIVEDFKISSRV